MIYLRDLLQNTMGSGRRPRPIVARRAAERHADKSVHVVALAGVAVALAIFCTGASIPSAHGAVHDFWGVEKPEPIDASSDMTATPTFAQLGVASWYGRWHKGRLTANGERFNPGAFTAAHRSLPFGTILRVTNLETGKMIKVRVNDRGPYIRSRALDLSAAAAKALGITRDGVKRVRIEAFAADQRSEGVTTASQR